ncbi:MAG: FliI/YscN family ATPase [Pirellulales bacterium]|nr:FliI/YscN family ATPase [Pirellulales bacterium]
MLAIESQLDQIMPTALAGSVSRIVGMTAAVAGLPAPIGALVEIDRETGNPLTAEVIGFREDLTIIYPWDDISGVRRGNRVRMVRTTPWLHVGDQLLGRVVDAQGRCIDGGPQPVLAHRAPLDRTPPAPMRRQRIATPLTTGVRSLDGMLTCGKGQRMGIFAGSGVGKSSTLGMMARYTSADVNVIGLIGERGREVREFIERDLGPTGMARSVVVVATSDAPAVLRVRAARTATTIAEYFRDQKRDVLLMLDSLTRFAQAQREIGLAAGEPPTTRGFPPSVFAMLPKLVERAGYDAEGSITGFYSVLVEADDPNEPISDAVRGLLDGHTWLSRKIAARGHYPAVDVLESISRLMTEVADREHQAAASIVRELLSAYREHADLISIGAYRRGSNPTVDLAIAMEGEINAFLRQAMDEPSNMADTRTALQNLIRSAAQKRQALSTPAQNPGGLRTG